MNGSGIRECKVYVCPVISECNVSGYTVNGDEDRGSESRFRYLVGGATRYEGGIAGEGGGARPSSFLHYGVGTRDHRQFSP